MKGWCSIPYGLPNLPLPKREYTHIQTISIRPVLQRVTIIEEFGLGNEQFNIQWIPIWETEGIYIISLGHWKIGVTKCYTGSNTIVLFTKIICQNCWQNKLWNQSLNCVEKLEASAVDALFTWRITTFNGTKFRKCVKAMVCNSRTDEVSMLNPRACPFLQTDIAVHFWNWIKRPFIKLASFKVDLLSYSNVSTSDIWELLL